MGAFTCPRCLKKVDTIHTCTPTDLVRKLEQEIERLRHDIERHIAIASEHATECERLRAELAECKMDAERYRWLRAQHWATSNLTAVRNPQQALRLGSDCPSGERLDALIDAALAAKEE